MIKLDSLIKKPEFEKDGEKIMDLTVTTVKFKTIEVDGTVIISEDLQMRPDLMSRIVYGNTNKFDLILKFNGVSNPFSLSEGQILLTGNELEMTNSYVTPASAASKDIRERFFDPNRLSKKDTKRLEYIKNKSKDIANKSVTNLPPNFAEVGSQEISIKDGKVIFGNDVVGKNKENCQETQSRAAVKAKLIQNKIFKT